MTKAEQDKLDEIERERRKREAALLALLLLLIGGSATVAGETRRNPRNLRRRLMEAISHGLPIEQVIRDTIGGNPSLQLPGLSPALIRAMAESWVTGYRRAFILAGEPIPADAGIPAAGVPFDDLPIYLAALHWAGGQVPGIIDGLIERLTALARKAIDAAREAGLSIAQTMKALGDAFTAAGWTATDPATVNPASKGSPGYAAVGLATETILTAWNGGLFNGYFGPMAEKALILRHFSVMDHRTSEICIDRNDLTLPANDPYWKSNSWPKLHNRCRSVVMPVPSHFEISDWRPTVPVQDGWGAPPAMAFGVRFA